VKRRIVVDASVVVKWLVPEDQSLRAVSLRERFDFAAPDLIHAEIVNILWKKARRGEIADVDALDGLRALRYAEFRLESSEELAEQAFELSRLIDHPAYDCFYLCAAVQLNTVLVTADERMLRKLSMTPHTEWTSAAVDLRTF
jgi:predicted nucleic acid-binding protein